MIKTAKALPSNRLKGIKRIQGDLDGEDLPADRAANTSSTPLRRGHRQRLNPALSRWPRGQGAGVVLLSFDNVIESDDNIVVNVDRSILAVFGEMALRSQGKRQAPRGRGPRNSVDRDRHDGFHESEEIGQEVRVVEWSASGMTHGAEGDRRRDRIHKNFAGIMFRRLDRYCAPSYSGIRWSDLRRDENGFASCAPERAKGLHCLAGRARPRSR